MIRAFIYLGLLLYIQLYSPHNTVAQANETTSKNTTNEIEKMSTVPLYIHKLLNSQNQLEIGLLPSGITSSHDFYI